MRTQRTPFAKAAVAVFASAVLLALACCTRNSTAQASPVDLQVGVKVPFRFVAYGDTRFHDPSDTEAANPTVRVALVQAIAEANPAFICFTGDIVYNGYDVNDWKVWDLETSIWREKAHPGLSRDRQPRTSRRRKNRAGKLFSALSRSEE